MPAYQPTIAVKHSRDALLGLGPSTGLRGGFFALVYVIGKGLYEWNTGDQSANVPGSNDSDLWIAPSEDESGKSGAWNLINAEFIDEDDMASDSDTRVPTQQSVKAWGLAAPGSSSDPSLAFDTWRTPNADRPTLVFLGLQVETDGTLGGQIVLEVDESGGTTANFTGRTLIDEDAPSGTTMRTMSSVVIPAGGSYRIVNSSDPNGANAVEEHREFTL